VIAGIIVAALPVNASTQPHPQNANWKRAAISDTTECPYCAEEVKVKATVCKHCGRDIGDKLKAEREDYLLKLSSAGDEPMYELPPKEYGPLLMEGGRCPRCQGVDSYMWKVDGEKVAICRVCSY